MQINKVGLGLITILFVTLACSPLALLIPGSGDAARGDQEGQPGVPEQVTPANGIAPTSGIAPTVPVSPTIPVELLETLNPGPPGVSPVGDADRPVMSGTPKTLDMPAFRVHYTLSGVDAVAPDDNNGNGHPDYVEVAAQALLDSWQVQIEHYGWAAPPGDGTLGGDPRFDLYIINADGEAYTDGGWAETVVGDNPNSGAVETDAAFSFSAIDNDFAELGLEFDGVDQLDYMRATVTHEFNHAIQFGYDSQEPADWLWEATASWIEDEVYDEINDTDQYLSAVFKSPDTCQIAEGGYERFEDDLHWYGEWVFLRYIAENHGGHATIRSIWEYARVYDGYLAIDAALVDVGTSLPEVYNGFSLALLTRNFEEGARYPTVRLEGVASVVETFAPGDGVGQMGSDFVEVDGDGVLTVALQSTGLSGMLAGFSGGQLSVFAMPGGQASINMAGFERVYLVVNNLARVEDEFNCERTPYIVTVTPGVQADGPVGVIPAPNFEVPSAEALVELDAEGNLVAPDELSPGYIPSGYSLAEVYELTRVDFGADEVDWFIPGNGPATVMDYYGPGEDFISVMRSDNPYRTLEEWLVAVDYEPYDDELMAIDGVLVLMLDLSDDQGLYSVANFMRNGNEFFVVEGTVSTAELARVVAGLVE